MKEITQLRRQTELQKFEKNHFQNFAIDNYEEKEPEEAVLWTAKPTR